MTRAKYRQLKEAYKVETNPKCKLALQVAMWMESPTDCSDIVGAMLCNCPSLLPYVHKVRQTWGNDANKRDLKLYRAYSRAASAKSSNGRGVEINVLLAGPSTAAVMAEYRKECPNGKVTTYSLQRSLDKLKLPYRRAKPGRPAA